MQALYLDKKLLNHSLLQTIARVNRPYNELKGHGLILDYYGIFDHLNEARNYRPDELGDVAFPFDTILEHFRKTFQEIWGLRVGVRESLVVVVPAGLGREKVQQLVSGKADWIAARLAEFDTVRHLIHKPVGARPQTFDLPALAESWRVAYREMRRPTVGATTDQPGRIVVYGAVSDVEACHAALRRWLARHATKTLPPWLERVAAQCGHTPTDISIKNQRTRWGSCAPSGRISLNCKLLFLPRELVRYVMVHEICHLLEANHSGHFWAHVQVSGTRQLRQSAPRRQRRHPAPLPLRARCMPEQAAVTLGEVRWRLETAGHRNLHDRHRRLQQQLARAAQAHVEVVLGGHLPHITLEQALDLPPRHTHQRGDLVQRERLLDVGLHQGGGFDEVLVVQAHPRLQRDVLAVLVVADAVQDELLGDQRCDAAPQVLPDDVQHFGRPRRRPHTRWAAVGV
jgi:predicted metal-dependent hydrolase